ncbi:glycosyltransferase [Agrobacterium sp. SHOUNA12C]|uniref:Glycosyltransferase protein n=1 Tax=Rhizobium rhizogenes (strain K84 / ATCC BAA-868) TaxID=311403 RepID=B9JKY7_RHIR8|nr:glycosyltransferase family 2 protein [Rhizobium rhizogenes]ACM30579.1 glycosyltransferase protein [Rhizobium rhizogenes K84]MCJ9722706.1 glycosyltransferase [Agrobacterium sp. BETTINA12B]MCJ9756718.1 glycosyltransferase [Agrobacterium sp. SHOUNA12C]OCJ16144.1 glycosyl transferase family A [Agrobacterium sp. B131/95]MDJ1637784.1 glycosyltransferase family 2 protein [Rhizobium rhizogenes]
MIDSAENNVCVIIAAKNASDTIGLAVASALREPEVAEVVVIDDGSTDGTAAAARQADDGSGRLIIQEFEKNRGPAAARNHAIEISRAPLISILDADDFFFPGRFKPLLASDDWDFVADNIAFVDSDTVSTAYTMLDHFDPKPRFLDLVAFVEGNISKRGVRRGEIGFLKPLMRRSFLDKHGLRYDEALRLGEDYDLYVRALAKAARYKIIHSCGYGAVVRSNSLSGQHRTDDLRRLYEADRAILAAGGLSPTDAAVIRRHEQHIRGRYELRHFLDIKSKSGMGAAASYALGKPAAIPAIAGGIFADKTERFRKGGSAPIAHSGANGLRYLLQAVPE